MKKMMLALALSVLGVSGALGVGCGGDKCAAYADDLIAKYEECEITTTPTPSGSSVCTEAEAALDECQDACLPLANCACWQNANGPTCATDAKPYDDCMANCKANAQ